MVNNKHNAKLIPKIYRKQIIEQELALEHITEKEFLNLEWGLLGTPPQPKANTTKEATPSKSITKNEPSKSFMIQKFFETSSNVVHSHHEEYSKMPQVPQESIGPPRRPSTRDSKDRTRTPSLERIIFLNWTSKIKEEGSTSYTK